MQFMLVTSCSQLHYKKLANILKIMLLASVNPVVTFIMQDLKFFICLYTFSRLVTTTLCCPMRNYPPSPASKALTSLCFSRWITLPGNILLTTILEGTLGKGCCCSFAKLTLREEATVQITSKHQHILSTWVQQIHHTHTHLWPARAVKCLYCVSLFSGKTVQSFMIYVINYRANLQWEHQYVLVFAL